MGRVRHAAVREMKDGPSSSVIRCRSQATSVAQKPGRCDRWTPENSRAMPFEHPQFITEVSTELAASFANELNDSFNIDKTSGWFGIGFRTALNGTSAAMT